MSIENKLQLTAYSKDDLKIFSYLCQDAIMSRDEYFYDKERNYFAATLSRYCWEKEVSNAHNVSFRVVTGLQFRNVDDIEYDNFKSEMSFYNLLAITYSKKNIVLNFSMSAKIKLNCNKINAIIEDIDVPWPTRLKPQHN